MMKIMFKGKSVNTGEWIESMTVSYGIIKHKYHKVFMEVAPNKWKGVISETVSRFLPMPDTNIEGVYVDSDIFEFDCTVDEHKDNPIRLKGVMNFDDLELRYQIEIFSKEYPRYICLWYSPDIMKNFQIIGNKVDNPELLNQ